MKHCAEYCLDMPDEFPAAELSAFMASARRVLLEPEKSPAWQEFGGATNLVGWRFKSSFDCWRIYKESLAIRGEGCTHEELHRREFALFGMFTAGVSCIESTVYALAALASDPKVLGIPFDPDQQRDCSPKRLVGWLSSHAKAARLRSSLASLISSQEWQLWVELRNRMAHRSNLPRRIFASAGAAPPPVKPLNFAATSSSPQVEAGFADFDHLHQWLAAELAQLLLAGTELISAPVPGD